MPASNKLPDDAKAAPGPRTPLSVAGAWSGSHLDCALESLGRAPSYSFRFNWFRVRPG